MEKIEILLNELEEEINASRKTLIGNNVVVNADVINDLIARIRESFPTNLIQANNILQDADAIRHDAQKKANDIVENAKYEAERLMKNSEIIKTAKYEAEKLKNQALSQKDKADYAARKRVDELLEMTEQSIADSLMIIRNEREAIWGGIKKKQ